MDLMQAVVLALIQGLTEFLPISSSAHLIILPKITNWPDQGLAYDVALNTATWLAVVIYFREDLRRLIAGWGRTVAERSWQNNHDGKLAWMVLVATIPVGLAGLFGHDLVEDHLRSLEVIAWATIVWGLVLWIADRRPGGLDLEQATWAIVLAVGLAQALALVPGTSRSGITITAALFMGLSRTAAARLSFLLAIPVGALAGGHEALGMFEAAEQTPWLAVGVGFAVAFVAAYVAIHYFLKLIARFSMTPFVVYRLALGALLLGAFAG